MAIETNGHLVESSMPIKKGRHNSLRPRKLQNRRKSQATRTFSVCARLATWLTLVTVIFQCPTSPAELTDESSRVCHPYLAIRSQFTPYLQPFYNTYAAPYVNSTWPYVERFDSRLLTPTVSLGRQSYENYCAPRIEKVREYSLKEWQNTVKPQLEVTTKKAWDRYNANLAPHISKAITAFTPHYELARDNLLLTYYSHLVPAYTSSIPYVERTYAHGRDFAVHIGIPYVQGIWRHIMAFIDRILWPKVRILYGENVEPQLVRIGERLGRYRDGKGVRTAADRVDSSSLSSSTTSLLSPISSTAAAHSTPSSVRSSASSSTTYEPRTAHMTEEEIAREKVTEDLHAWHEKFAKAADKGAEDLEDRVKQLTEEQISRQAHIVGQALVVQLEETVKREFRTLKDKIVNIVKSIPSSAVEDDLENADSELHMAIRAAGLAMKEKAVELRTWKHNYHEETDRLVAAATETTLEVLDNIRDLGLQEIGMRWAWMEGVTYKDWSEYHAQRKTFDQWRDEVGATAKQHKGLAKAKEVGDDVEGRGMAIAEEAARELRRLKEVAKWKIEAQDSSNDFAIKYAPAAAMTIGQKILRKAKDAVPGASDTASGSVTSKVAGETTEAGSKAKDPPEIVSEAVYDTEPDTLEKAATKIPDALTGSRQPKAESAVSATSRVVGQFISHASEAIANTPPSPHRSFASIASERIECAASAISGGIHGKESPSSSPDNFSSVANAASSVASLLASGASNKVWGGASARQVDARPIIYEAGEQIFGSETSLAESIMSQVGSYAAAATDETAQQYEAIRALVSELVSGKEPDFTESVMDRLNLAYRTGAPEVISQASSIASETYRTASSAIPSVFTPPPVLEAIFDSASEKANSAVEAASIQIYATPKATLEKVTSVAAEVYESAASPRMSKAIYGAQSGYIEAAQASVSEVAASAQSAISTAIYGTEKGYVERISSATSEAYASTSSATADNIYAAPSVVGGNVSAAKSRVSEGVYGAPQGVVESARNRLPEALYMPQQEAMQSAQSRLNAAVESARARLSEFVENTGETASEAPSAAKESVESLASQVSSAADRAPTTAMLQGELR